MKTDILIRHVIDTVKEWQIKIGYMPGNMKLYYPSSSLISLLGLSKTANETDLMMALRDFCVEQEDVFGLIKISCDEAKERYCLDIPSKGTEYIAYQIAEPEFLKLFLKCITTPGKTIEDVRACFEEYAKKKEVIVHEIDQQAEGLGYTFYFEDCEDEPYIYCVESDGFGLTYHRFDHEDYEMLKHEGHHHGV